MLGRGSAISRLLLSRGDCQPAVLASAYASAAAAVLQQAGDGSSRSAQAAAAGAAGLGRLKERLAAGPDLGDFVAGNAADERPATPYSVYAPGFKVSLHLWLASAYMH